MIDLDDLEKKAREATPGPWVTYLNTMDDVVVRKLNAAGYESCVIAKKAQHKNAAHIAAANPSAILDLVARCRKAAAEVERLKLIEDSALKVCGQLDEVVLAMPYDYLDPPDGGDVSLGEQVKRMYSEVKMLREQLAVHEECAKRFIVADESMQNRLAAADTEIERLHRQCERAITLNEPEYKALKARVAELEAQSVEAFRWLYTTNGLHEWCSKVRPPDDAYDEGSLKPLYLRAPQAAEWQPIETAPKDSSFFLCWVSAVKYGTDDDGRQFEQDVSAVDFCWWRPGQEPDSGYFDNSCDQLGDYQRITHWMPLPAAPSPEGEKNV